MTTFKKEKSMNWPRLIGGIICLALGALLAVLTVALPEDKLMFTVGDQNMPIVPAIFLAALGVVLIITSRVSKDDGDAKWTEAPKAQSEELVALNKRLESIGWGLFLVMLGGTILIPEELVPTGLWTVGVGLIMLGLNIARYFNGIRMSGFTTVLGLLALIGGTAQLLGVELLDGGLLLIIIGAYLILKPWFDKRQLFGKAEDRR